MNYMRSLFVFVLALLAGTLAAQTAPALFDSRISSADVGYLKPHPKIFEAALDCLHVQADEAVFVGDNPVADIAGAQTVGLRAIMVVNGQIPSLASDLIVPDAQIDSLAELPSLLETFS